ncbi:putative aTP-dependent transcriptional regulator, partial [Vibrio parahaemolyticus V-223/04]
MFGASPTNTNLPHRLMSLQLKWQTTSELHG